MTTLKAFWKIKIYVPNILSPESRAIEEISQKTARVSSKIITAIRSIPGAGEVGKYSGLYEVDVGFEGYQPEKGASPRYGKIGEGAIIGKSTIITYLDRVRGERVLDDLVNAIVNAHPWEHPVIEITDCFLYVPN
jgi:hypothetical protein